MTHNQIDLHIHSSVSKDAQYSPSTCVQLCHKAHLKVISIADHNSIRGFQEAQATIQAMKLDLLLIPGIELDCHYLGTNLHILGYGINPTEPWFNTYDQSINDQDRSASLTRADMIRALGIHLDQKALDEISIDGVLTGEMIAEIALQDEKNNDNEVLKPYRKGASRGDNPWINFYWDFLSQGKAAYVEVEYVTAAQAIQAIKDAGGLAVLAHPGNNIGMDETQLKGIIGLGIDGIEVYSSYHSAETIEFYRKKTLEAGLLMTLGSDFHGKSKPSISLGNTDCPDEKIITETFLNRLEIHGLLSISNKN